MGRINVSLIGACVLGAAYAQAIVTSASVSQATARTPGSALHKITEQQQALKTKNRTTSHLSATHLS